MLTTEETTRQNYERAKELIITEKRDKEEAIKILEEEGLDNEYASKLIGYASGTTNANESEYQIVEEESSGAGVKDMVIGGLFCIGGTIATVADVGYIFWGAIIFGGIQFVSGLMKSLS